MGHSNYLDRTPLSHTFTNHIPRPSTRPHKHIKVVLFNSGGNSNFVHHRTFSYFFLRQNLSSSHSNKFVFVSVVIGLLVISNIGLMY